MQDLGIIGRHDGELLAPGVIRGKGESTSWVYEWLVHWHRTPTAFATNLPNVGTLRISAKPAEIYSTAG